MAIVIQEHENHYSIHFLGTWKNIKVDNQKQKMTLCYQNGHLVIFVIHLMWREMVIRLYIHHPNHTAVTCITSLLRS